MSSLSILNWLQQIAVELQESALQILGATVLATAHLLPICCVHHSLLSFRDTLTDLNEMIAVPKSTVDVDIPTKKKFHKYKTK